MKAQVLANFIAEFTTLEDEEAQGESTRWMIYTDGSSVQKTGGVGVIILTPQGDSLKYRV